MTPPARFLDVTTAQYHEDPCERPSLSSSIAAELIHRSPLHAWQMHPRLGGASREATASTTNGTLIHALVLGEGEEQLAVLDVDSFRTNAAKDLRDKALAAGKTVVRASEYAEAQKVAVETQKRIAALGIALGGTSEEKVEWTEETDEGPVLCRGMIDHLVMRFGGTASATIYDLKTIRSGDLRTVQRHVHDYGYDIQEAAYRSAIGAMSPEARGRIDVVFLFAEIEPPYAVTPVQLDGQWRAIGETKWAQACHSWARCLKTNKWPSYVDQITQVSPPAWASLLGG